MWNKWPNCTWLFHSPHPMWLNMQVPQDINLSIPCSTRFVHSNGFFKCPPVFNTPFLKRWSPTSLPLSVGWTQWLVSMNRMWQKLPCVTSETSDKQQCSFPVLDHLLWKSQLLCCEKAEIALWKGPFGKELGSPANRHGSESSWQWILCPSLPFRWPQAQPRPGLQPYERSWAGNHQSSILWFLELQKWCEINVYCCLKPPSLRMICFA